MILHLPDPDTKFAKTHARPSDTARPSLPPCSARPTLRWDKHLCPHCCTTVPFWLLVLSLASVWIFASAVICSIRLLYYPDSCTFLNSPSHVSTWCACTTIPLHLWYNVRYCAFLQIWQTFDSASGNCYSGSAPVQPRLPTPLWRVQRVSMTGKLVACVASFVVLM